jgi:uncharacterized protein
MKKQHSGRSKSRIRILARVLGALAVGTAAAPAPPVVGDWEGRLNAGGSSLRVVLHVTQDSDRKLRGTVDSPDQGATGIAISSISFKPPDVHFEIERLASSYDGKMNEDNSEIGGEWKQEGGSFALMFKRTSK